MEEEPSSQQQESSELSDLDGELQSDLGQENQEPGEDQGEGQEDDEAASGSQSDNGSGQEEQEQLESVWEGGEDFPSQTPARSEKKSTPKRQKPSLQRALEPVPQRGQPRGQFYEMLYEIEHLIKIVQQQNGEKVVIVKWRNFALSECTRQPLSYIKQIDLMKDEVEKLEEQFQQTKFAPESIVRVKTKIREYLDGYRKMVFPVADPSGQTEIQVGGMGPLNANNQQRQISFQQLTRCQAAAFNSTRKKFQILLNDATEQDYYHLRSVFYDSYLKVKNNRKLYREFGLQKKKSMLPIYQSRQIPRFKTNVSKRKVPKLKMSRELANHKVEEVIAVQRDGDVFNYCIQENKRVYIVTLSQMRKYFPRTLPRFLRELLDLMEEVMHLQIDPDEHFMNYRMTRFRESNRAKQIIQLTDKEGQPIYFGADDEDVEENMRIDIQFELLEAEREQEEQEEAQYRGHSMMDLEEEERSHHQESEMKDQVEQARHISRDQEKEWRRHMEMEMEMINLNTKQPANTDPPPADPKNGTQMDIENEGNVQNQNTMQREDEMIDLNSEEDDYSEEYSSQSQSSAGTFDEDYEEMRQALQYYGVQIDLDQLFDEQQEAQPQEQQVAIDFNLMELQNLRYYDDNDLIETGGQPRLSKKEMKKLDKADKQVLGIKQKNGEDNSQEEKEDGQQQSENSQDGEGEQMQQEEPEEFDSEVQPDSDSEESSDGLGLLKRDRKEEKMLKKGILPDQQMEVQSLSGFSYSESSLSSSLGPNAMEQEPSSRQYIPRYPTQYVQPQPIPNRSFKRIKQKVNQSLNPPEVIQISSDSSPLGRSTKKQKRY